MYVLCLYRGLVFLTCRSTSWNRVKRMLQKGSHFLYTHIYIFTIKTAKSEQISLAYSKTISFLIDILRDVPPVVPAALPSLEGPQSDGQQHSYALC